MQFILNNWYIIVALLALAAVIGFRVHSVVKKARENPEGGNPLEDELLKVKEWLVWATVEAERKLGSGTGRLKLRLVYDMFVSKFPWIAQVLPFTRFGDLVDDALKETNKLLTGNVAVQLYVNGPSEPAESDTAEG